MKRSKSIKKRKIPYLNITISEDPKLRDKSKLGYWCPKSNRIAIKPNQPWVGKNVVLLHEAIHAADDALINAGITEHRIDHHWIENASVNLLLILVMADLWKGVSKQELIEFIKHLP